MQIRPAEWSLVFFILFWLSLAQNKGDGMGAEPVTGCPDGDVIVDEMPEYRKIVRSEPGGEGMDPVRGNEGISIYR
jgi:hypothetical protein